MSIILPAKWRYPTTRWRCTGLGSSRQNCKTSTSLHFSRLFLLWPSCTACKFKLELGRAQNSRWQIPTANQKSQTLTLIFNGISELFHIYSVLHVVFSGFIRGHLELLFLSTKYHVELSHCLFNCSNKNKEHDVSCLVEGKPKTLTFITTGPFEDHLTSSGMFFSKDSFRLGPAPNSLGLNTFWHERHQEFWASWLTIK